MFRREDGLELLRQFPPVEGAFAYGSGAIEQSGYDYTVKSSSELPMMDLVFIVSDTAAWHERNMAINPDHYTTPVPMSSAAVSCVQDQLGAGIWYNPMIPMNIKSSPERSMKYGVISLQKFLEDVLDWRFLYVAGRLHKPVHMICSQPLIDHAIERNRENAMRVALLLLPSSFSESDLFVTIAGLSYLGDPRMGIGENPRKVNNLVTAALPSYRDIYKSSLQSLSSAVNLQSSVYEPKTVYTQDVSPAVRWQLSESLPKTMKSLLMIRSRSKYLKGQHPPQRTALRAGLVSIVARSATTQSMKGLLSAGLVKCSVYIFAKVLKRFSKQPASAFSSVSSAALAF